MSFFRFSILLVLCLGSLSLNAQVFSLSNGDRISAALTDEDDQYYYLSHDMLGDLSLLKEHVLVAEVHCSSSEEAKSDSEVCSSSGIWDDILVWKESLTWHGRIALGYENKRSTVDSEQTTAIFDIEKKWDANTVSANLDYKLRKQQAESKSKVVTDDRFLGTLFGRHDLSERYFIKSVSKYKQDAVQKIDHEFSQSLGLGIQVCDLDKFKFAVTPAVSVRYQKRVGARRMNRGFITLYEDLEYVFSDTVRFLQDSTSSFDPVHSELYLETKLRLIVSLSELLELEARYEFEFDNQVASGVEKRTDHYVLVVGVPF